MKSWIGAEFARKDRSVEVEAGRGQRCRVVNLLLGSGLNANITETESERQLTREKTTSLTRVVDDARSSLSSDSGFPPKPWNAFIPRKANQLVELEARDNGEWRRRGGTRSTLSGQSRTSSTSHESSNQSNYSNESFLATSSLALWDVLWPFGRIHIVWLDTSVPRLFNLLVVYVGSDRTPLLVDTGALDSFDWARSVFVACPTYMKECGEVEVPTEHSPLERCYWLRRIEGVDHSRNLWKKRMRFKSAHHVQSVESGFH